MARPKSGTAQSNAERQQALRDRRSADGIAPWRPDLSAETRVKAERIAAARGITPAAAVNALVDEAPE